MGVQIKWTNTRINIVKRCCNCYAMNEADAKSMYKLAH